MSFWRAKPSLGGWIGIILMVIVAAIIGFLFTLLVSGPLNFISFLLGLLTAASAILLAILAYWTYGYYSLYYTLDRDVLRIRWTGFETVVPISEIRKVVAGEIDRSRVWLPLLRWPGYCIGKGHINKIGEVVYYATGCGSDQLLLLTDKGSYVICPEDPEAFTQALELRQSLGPVRPAVSDVFAFGLLRLPVWSDHLAHWLWLGALVLNIILFAYLCAIYPNLDPIVPVHFDALGQVDRVAPAVVVFFIPAIGWLVLIVNGLLGLWVHHKHRLATLLLWGGTGIVQGYLWLAALGITFHEMAG